VTYPAVSKSPG